MKCQKYGQVYIKKNEMPRQYFIFFFKKKLLFLTPYIVSTKYKNSGYKKENPNKK